MNISRPTMQDCTNRTLLIIRVAIKGSQMTNGTITNLAYHDDDATGHDFNDHDAYLRDSVSFYINQGDMVENQC